MSTLDSANRDRNGVGRALKRKFPATFSFSYGGLLWYAGSQVYTAYICLSIICCCRNSFLVPKLWIWLPFALPRYWCPLGGRQEGKMPTKCHSTCAYLCVFALLWFEKSLVHAVQRTFRPCPKFRPYNDGPFPLPNEILYISFLYSDHNASQLRAR